MEEIQNLTKINEEEKNITEKIKEEILQERKILTEESKHIYKFLETIISKLPRAKKYYLSISNSIYSNLEFDIAFLCAVNRIDSELREASGEKVFLEDKDWLESIRKKFSKILLVDKLIFASGLITYRDDILVSLIEDVFGLKSKPSRNKEKDTLNYSKLLEIFSEIRDRLPVERKEKLTKKEKVRKLVDIKNKKIGRFEKT